MLDINGELFHAVLGALYKRLNRMDKAIEAYKAAELVTPAKLLPCRQSSNIILSERRSGAS